MQKPRKTQSSFIQHILSQYQPDGRACQTTEGHAPNVLPSEGRKALAEEAMQLSLALSWHLYFILRQDLNMYPRLVLNYVPVSASFPQARIIHMATKYHECYGYESGINHKEV